MNLEDALKASRLPERPQLGAKWKVHVGLGRNEFILPSATAYNHYFKNKKKEKALSFPQFSGECGPLPDAEAQAAWSGTAVPSNGHLL